MGVLDFVKNTAKGMKKVFIGSSLGNVLIAGVSRKGSDEIIQNYAVDSLSNNNGIIIFRDSATGISSYPSISSSPRAILDVDCSENSTTGQIDVFSGLTDAEINSYIIKLFDLYNTIDNSKKMRYLNYVALLRSLMKKAGKRVKLNNLSDYPIEELENCNALYCSGMEFSRNERFLDGIRTDISDLESYFWDFSTNVAGFVLSGTNSIEQLFKSKKIIEISLNYTGFPEESIVIMSAIIDAISRINYSITSVSGVKVIVDGAPNEILINSGLQKLIRCSRRINVLFTVQDISNLIESSNEWIDFADSYFFFRQNSNKNKEFCSEFFGEYERKKETISNTSNSSTFWDLVGGKSVEPNKTRSKTVSIEKERVYFPEAFASLPDNKAVYYSKARCEHMYLTVY